MFQLFGPAAILQAVIYILNFFESYSKIKIIDCHNKCNNNLIRTCYNRYSPQLNGSLYICLCTLYIHLITYRLFMNNELRVLLTWWWHVESILARPQRLIKNDAIKVNGIINFASD